MTRFRMILGTLLFGCIALSSACGSEPAACPEGPTGAGIQITTTPRRGSGGPEEMDDISGKVTAVDPKDTRVVIYAHAGDRWWIQPFEDAPMTVIRSNLQWSARIHLGFEYAALLVYRNFVPQKQPMGLPQIEGCVWAVAVEQPAPH